MNKYITRKNIGWVMSALLSFFLLMGAFGKISGNEAVAAMLATGNLEKWMLIIGIGELASLVLFLIPKTMKIGTLLLSAYFGGAILFHMGNTNPDHQSFFGTVVFLLFVWIISWIRGNELV